MTTASRLIQQARRGAGLSQRQLAALAGTSQAVISAYENGRREPGFEQLNRVLSAAGYVLDTSLRRAREASPVTGADPWTAVDTEDLDRIAENLRLTPQQRLRRLGALRGFATKHRGALARKT